MIDMRAVADELKSARAEEIERRLRSKEDAKLIVSAAFSFTIQDAVDNIIDVIRQDVSDQMKDLGKMEDQLAVAYALCAADNIDNSKYEAMEDTLKLRLTEEFNKINVPELSVEIDRVGINRSIGTGLSCQLDMCGGYNLVSFLVKNYPQYFNKSDVETSITLDMQEIVATEVYVHFDAVLT